MLTRIEIDGFKSFRNFAVDLKPFQVFIGANGVGKTNLFDAIALLAALAEDAPLQEAFKQGRGQLAELFSLGSDGKRQLVMRFAAEMLLDKTVSINERPRALACNRLRYELELGLRPDDNTIFIRNEKLAGISDTNDKWAKDALSAKTRKAIILRERRAPYIETLESETKTTIYRNQDAPAGGREAISAASSNRTALSGAAALPYPTIHAARQEMRNWRFLQLQAHALRQPAAKAESLLADGANLAGVVARIAENPAKLAAITKDIGGFIASIKHVTAQPTEEGQFLIDVETHENAHFSSRLLSDGTLRLLALVALRHDPLHQGLLCFEEPENGVQPMRLRQIVDILFALSSRLDEDTPAPLRQVIINTHSPLFLASVPADSILYVYMKAEKEGRFSRLVPVLPELIQDEEERYLTWPQVSQYLDAVNRQKSTGDL
jgi:predicted ATPase